MKQTWAAKWPVCRSILCVVVVINFSKPFSSFLLVFIFGSIRTTNIYNEMDVCVWAFQCICVCFSEWLRPLNSVFQRKSLVAFDGAIAVCFNWVIPTLHLVPKIWFYWIGTHNSRACDCHRIRQRVWIWIELNEQQCQTFCNCSLCAWNNSLVATGH